MKKLLITYCLSLIAVMFPLQSVYAAEASLSVSPASGVFNKGCGFSVNIMVDTGGTPTDGTDAILFYDPTRFKINQIRNGSTYSDYASPIIDSQNGKIAVTGTSPMSSSFTGSGVLATIDLEVLDTAPDGASQIKFDFDPADKGKTTDSNVVEEKAVIDILGRVTDGTYTVGTGSCKISPTPTDVSGGSSNNGNNRNIGGPDDGTDTTPPVKTLPQSADITPTVLLATAGGLLVIFGILGLAFLS